MTHGMDKAYAVACSPCARVCFFALLLLVPQVYARQAASGVRGTVALDRSYHHTVWTTEEGLPQNSINDIVQTRDGYLWLATFGGLVRFDGMTFKVFDRANAEGLAGNRITALYEDRAGVLWIGHEAGAVSRYADGVFMHSTVADGLSGGTVFDFAEDAEGTLWMTTEKGLVRFSEGRFRVYTTRDGLPGDFIFSLLLDREGRLWISMEEGLGYYAEGRFTFFTEENGLPDPFTTALFEDRTGRLWVSSPMGFYYEDGQFTPFSRPGWPPQYVAKFWVDRQDNLWVGYEHGRLVRFASETASNARSDRAPAASISLGAQIRPIFEDREGNLWVGTNGAGLHRFHERPVIQYTPEDILPSIRVSRVTEGAPGEFWLNDGCRALVRYRGGTFTAYSSFDPDGLFQDRLFGCIGSLLGDRAGTIWIGNTKEGNHRLIRFRDGDYTLFTREDGVPDADIYALFEDRDGDLWLGTQGQGVVHFKEETAFAHYTTADGLVHDDVRFITQDRDGVLWFGTAGGLSRFEDGLFTNYTAEADLAPGMVRALHIDPDGTLWVGTYGGGLSRLKDGHITRYTTDDGLAENFISRILEDEQGKLWMLGNLGLSVLPRAMLNDFAEGRIASVEPILLGTTEGMAEGNGGGQPAGWQAEDGRMWFPTIEGLAVVDARHFRWNTAPPPVVIERVLADGQEMDLRQDVAAPPGPRDLEIHYTGLSYVAPEQVRFKYKLDGYDEAWIEVGTRRVAYYTNIAPGRYTFRVQASNNHGVWNEEGASLSIALAPFFYETLWFYGVSGLLLLLLGYAGYWQRTRSIRARNAELAALNSKLNEEAKERKHAEILLEAQNEELEAQNAELERYAYTVSHDLKSPLVTIKGFTSMLREDVALGEAERVEADLTHIETAAEQMYHLLADLLELSRQGRVINVSEEVSLSVLAEEAVGLLAGLMVARGVEVAIAPDQPMVWGDRVRLREVYQNLIENAVKYMGNQAAPRIEVGARKNGVDEVLCWVRDNGIGIDPAFHEQVFRLFDQLDPAMEGTGTGLALVKRIVEVHGGRIWIESEGVGHGVTFCFNLPV